MRHVKVFKWEKRHREDGAPYMEKVEDGEAMFHQFGIDSEEYESGPAPFTTAVIERADGTVENRPVALIQFVKPWTT